MQIISNTSYDFGSTYNIKLNDKQMLVVDEDPFSKSQFESRKATHEKELEEKKAKQNQKTDNPDDLNDDEKRLVKDLSSRDNEVKAHEAAHQASGGGMTGAASYTYQQGPDGKMYAIGGEVSIASPSGSTPEETIKNARQIAAAAMAAGNPSPQDFSVASSARVMEMKAQQQLSKEAQEKTLGKETYANIGNEKNNNTEDKSIKLDIPA